MHEARLENGPTPLGVGDAPRVDLGELIQRIEHVLPLVENVLQAAGYLVLTIGAAWLLFRFAP